MRIVLFGKPGSGKGTQAGMLSKQLSLPHLSSGEILREEIRERTPFGVMIEEYVLRGEIGPQELIADLVLGHIRRKGFGAGYVLDGFPRTLYQAERLEGLYPPEVCALIDVPDDTVVGRISKRLGCGGCGRVYHETLSPPARAGICDSCGGALARRDDDLPGAIERRLAVYRDEVRPAIDFYGPSGRLIRIDGTGTPEGVFKSIKKAISSL